MATPAYAEHMLSYKTNDNITIKYIDTAAFDPSAREKEILILIHGFTGSSLVWQRNIPALSAVYRVIAPDLRGHGVSDKPRHGFHVARLAMDLRELVGVLNAEIKGKEGEGKVVGMRAMGGSLGCAVLWSYATLFTTQPFTHLLFIDQSPLQNTSPYPSPIAKPSIPSWTTPYCHAGLNSPSSLLTLQSTLLSTPAKAHLGTIQSCLGYRAFPRDTDRVKEGSKEAEADEKFFLGEALKGNGMWLGRLMADHTALDWREGIKACLGRGSGSATKVLVITSSRSGCFAPEGPLHVVDLINDAAPQESNLKATRTEGVKETPPAKGVIVDWGGHWMYWEEPEKFNEDALEFLK